ncbi:MAG TPA: M50 family metallopeptidase [Actinomycetota bacterium]|nr:M50 family metallopeptidase [Actinomycetota bacterium]
MNGGWRVGRIGGIEIRLDASLAILAAIVGFYLWQIFSVEGAPLEIGELALAAGGAVMFIGSILVHELAHALFARLRGIPVSHVRLFVFGGGAYTTEETKKPLDEFVLTVVGPLASAAVGAAFVVAYRFSDSPFASVFQLLLVLGVWNLTLAVFNLLPGLPLDGGRILHSAVWKITGNRYTATVVAGRAGQALGILMVAGGVWVLFRSNDIWDLWFVLIGWEVHRAASAELAMSRGRRLAGRKLRELMTAPPPVIPAELSIREATDSFLDGHEGEAFPVMRDGRILGFVSSRDVERASPESRVGEFVFQEPGAVEAGPEETIQEVGERLGRGDWQAILVVEDGRLIGVLERPAPSVPRRRWTQ